MHIKAPFIQEVHSINVKSYNRLSLNIPEADSINAEIVWHVNDSKKFFEATKYENIDKIFDTQILPILNKIGSSSDITVLIDIAEAQKRNANYSNALIERLIVDIQEPIRPYGIGIVHILIKKYQYSQYNSLQRPAPRKLIQN